MTTIAAGLSELDAATRRAWEDYTERVRDLTGEEYERVEHESWEQLQRELGALEDRRRSLSATER